jgi:hypothetical protein
MTYTHENIDELLPGMSLKSLRRAMADDGLPGRKIGRKYFFDEAAVRSWLAGRDQQAAHERNKRVIRAAKDDPKRYRDEFGEGE